MTKQEMIDQLTGKKPQPRPAEATGQPGTGEGQPPPPTTAKGQGAAPPAPPSAPDPNAPDTSRPQTWRDWFVKNYNPSLGDYAKIYGDAFTYGLTPLAARGVEATGYGRELPMSSGDIANQVEQARRNAGPMGPFISAAGYMTSPLTYYGVGPISRAVGAGAEALPFVSRLPGAVSRYIAPAVSGGTTASITAGAQEAGLGGSPADILKSAAEAFPVGGVFGAGARAITPEGVTPADVTAKTAANQQALQAQLDKMRTANLGFQIQGKTPQTEAELKSTLDWLKTVTPEQDPGGAGQVLQTRIEKALSAPETAQAQQAASTAAQQNTYADLLQRWNKMVDTPGADIRKQAVQQMAGLDPSSPQFEAFNRIASAPASYTPAWLSYAQSGLEMAPTAIGEALGMQHGLPFGGISGQTIGKGLSWGLGKLAGAQQTASPLAQQIANAARPLTGYGVSPGGDPNTLANAMTYIYQNQPGLSW